MLRLGGLARRRLSKSFPTKTPNPETKLITTQLPYDVFYIIIAYVALNNPGDMKSLALVNRAFLAEISRWLWKDLRILTEANTPVSKLDDKLAAFLRRPDHLVHVRNLQLLVRCQVPEPFAGQFNFRLQKLLVAATGVQSLTISDEYQQILPRLVAAKLSFAPQLEEFTYHEKITPELWQFVGSLHSIRRLTFVRQNRGFTMFNNDLGDPELLNNNLPDTALRDLEAVLAPIGLLPGLIRGRPIKCISVKIHAPADIHTLWEAIRSSTKPITSLSVRMAPNEEWANMAQSLLEDLPQHAPCLQYLSLTWFSMREPVDLSSASLRELTALKCVRWRDTGVFGETVRLTSPTWHPSMYAGPALEIAQHESPRADRHHVKPGEERVGVWERDGEFGEWKARPHHYVSPPLTSPTQTIDPLALQYI